MMTSAPVGLLLGAVAGALHLMLTHRRARLVCTGRVGASLLLAPLGFGCIAGSVLLAAAYDPASAWSTLPGLALVRGFTLWKVSDAE